MTKASSRRSSATATPADSNVGEEGKLDDSAKVAPVEGKQGDSPPSTTLSNGTGSTSTTAAAKLSDTGTGEVQTTGSEPMTASNSNSSIRTAKISGPAATTSGTATYGTRSTRTRTGTSRPNYAEDSALDAEFEIVPHAKEKIGRKGAHTAEPPSSNASDTGKSVANSPQVAGTESEQNSAGQNASKDGIPGTSTFSSTATATAPALSRKRKANNPNNTTAQQNGSTLLTNGKNKNGTVFHIAAGFRETNMLTFDNSGSFLKAGKLIADDGTVLSINDHVYAICEPPGEPYYIGRIMAWVHVDNDTKQPLEALRLNWYYRPKDIGRKVNDTRQVFASMHTDINPLTAIRGKCEIKHKSEIQDMDAFRASKDCFYFEKLYDRYIHRYYEVVPTKAVINLPDNVKKVLNERWVYILAETNRAKEYTTASKTCKRCKQYCASNEGVDCAICRNTYHMSCVSPPLLKKPTRGFAWACGPCSKAQAKKLEARNTPTLSSQAVEGEDEDVNDEDESSPGTTEDPSGTGQTTPADTNGMDLDVSKTSITQENRGFLWRYLGIHCNVEDALDVDDRIHPRASSRLGPRHQANVIDWPGRPMEYIKPPEVKRKYTKGGGAKKETKVSKEALAALEAEKLAREQRPKYITEEPTGFVHRGEDLPNDDPNCTAKLLYKLPDPDELSDPAIAANNLDLVDEETRIRVVHEYVIKVIQQVSPIYHLPHMSTNLLDIAVEVLRSNSYDTERALEAMKHVDKKIFKEPNPTATELKKFEDGVSKFGSEWYSIKKHVKTMKAADIVRFYYTWKKTDRGKQVCSTILGRKVKKDAKRAEATKTAVKLQDDVADEYDDSAFDNDKAYRRKRGFQCKFCDTRSSRQWRRAPNTTPGTTVYENPGKGPAKEKGAQLLVALCRRCAELWRRYAIQWEDVDELSKKAVLNGTKPFKRKIDEETIKEILAANEVSNVSTHSGVIRPPTPIDGTPAPAPTAAVPTATEPPRKKAKTAVEPEIAEPVVQPAPVAAPPKKKVIPEKIVAPPPPPPPPEPPKAKILACAICAEVEPMEQHLTCKECRLSVHRSCYGVVGDRSKWTCDMCANDKNPQVSVQYKCMLCPIEHTEHDFVEPVKASHKKKSEKEREKERIEREKAQKDADFFRKKQEELNKPVNPREPLKRTANNNWVHVTCAVFTPEVKFGNAKALEPSEGIPSIPSSRYEDVCKVCKLKAGACVNCHSCKASMHVECARQAGYVLGFDITPVKGSRKDQVPIVNIKGDVGTMVAAIWCKEHIPQKTVVHHIQDIVDDETGQTALQLYSQKFKQADLTLTGTVRKATLINQSTKAVQPAPVAVYGTRRISTIHTNGTSHAGRNSLSHAKVEENASEKADNELKRICATCEVDVSPKWWSFPAVEVLPEPAAIRVNGTGHDAIDHVVSAESLGDDSGGHAALAAAALHQDTKPSHQEPIEFQCHKCHFKKVKREPTPVPEPPTPPPAPVPVVPREEIRLHNHIPPPIGIPPPDVEMNQAPRVPPGYAWQVPPSGYGNGSYNGWSRPSPVSQVSAHISHINGNGPPRLPSVVHSPNGHSRPSIQTVPHSPLQNGHIPHMTNGYPPRSPHGGMGMHIPNGNYGPYTSPRVETHHLTNGVPPPRPNDPPFSNHNGSHDQMYQRPPYAPAQSSPPLLNNHLQSRANSISHPTSNGHQENGRVNGGASASPSLRNLLS